MRLTLHHHQSIAILVHQAHFVPSQSIAILAHEAHFVSSPVHSYFGSKAHFEMSLVRSYFDSCILIRGRSTQAVFYYQLLLLLLPILLPFPTMVVGQKTVAEVIHQKELVAVNQYKTLISERSNAHFLYRYMI